MRKPTEHDINMQQSIIIRLTKINTVTQSRVIAGHRGMAKQQELGRSNQKELTKWERS